MPLPPSPRRGKRGREWLKESQPPVLDREMLVKQFYSESPPIPSRPVKRTPKTIGMTDKPTSLSQIDINEALRIEAQEELLNADEERLQLAQAGPSDTSTSTKRKRPSEPDNDSKRDGSVGESSLKHARKEAVVMKGGIGLPPSPRPGKRTRQRLKASMPPLLSREEILAQINSQPPPIPPRPAKRAQKAHSSAKNKSPSFDINLNEPLRLRREEPLDLLNASRYDSGLPQAESSTLTKRNMSFGADRAGQGGSASQAVEKSREEVVPAKSGDKEFGGEGNSGGSTSEHARKKETPEVQLEKGGKVGRPRWKTAN